MTWQNVSELVSKYSPLLGSLINNDSKYIISLILTKFDIKFEEISPDSVYKVIEQDINAISKLKSLAEEYKTELSQIALLAESSRYKLLTTTSYSPDKFSLRFVYYYAWTITVLSMLYVGCVTFLNIPQSGVRIADTAVGFALGSIVSTIVGFFFGSSDQNMKKKIEK